MTAVIAKAAGEARRLRQNWLGPCHYLLAVLAETSAATDAMAELGVTHDRLAQALSAANTVNDRRVRFFKSKGTTTNPAAHAVSGWTAGFAAASGRRQPGPADWLLATVYQDSGMVGSVLHNLGVSAAAIIAALRRRGGGSTRGRTAPARCSSWPRRGSTSRRSSPRSWRERARRRSHV